MLLRNDYDGEGRIAKQSFADGQTYCFNYSVRSGDSQETVIVRPQVGAIKVRFHDDGTYEINESSVSSRCEQSLAKALSDVHCQQDLKSAR